MDAIEERVRSGIDFASACFPRKTRSGDFFDVWSAGSYSLGLVIGEISGDSSPRMMASMVGKLRQAGSAPWRALRRLNDALAEHCVTLALLLIEHRTVRILSAGHPAPILMTRDGDVKLAEVEGAALGLLPGSQFADSLREAVLDLDRLSRIVLCSGAFPDLDVVARVLKSAPFADSPGIIDRLVEVVPRPGLTILCLTVEGCDA